MFFCFPPFCISIYLSLFPPPLKPFFLPSLPFFISLSLSFSHFATRSPVTANSINRVTLTGKMLPHKLGNQIIEESDRASHPAMFVYTKSDYVRPPLFLLTDPTHLRQTLILLHGDFAWKCQYFLSYIHSLRVKSNLQINESRYATNYNVSKTP